MANGIRTGNPRGFNKGRSSKFREGSQVWQTPEEGRRTYRLKRCGNNNKDEDNSPKNLNDKNQQASSQKFRQLISITIVTHFVTAFKIPSDFSQTIKVYLFLNIQSFEILQSLSCGKWYLTGGGTVMQRMPNPWGSSPNPVISLREFILIDIGAQFKVRKN